MNARLRGPIFVDFSNLSVPSPGGVGMGKLKTHVTNPNPKVRKSGAVGKAVLAQDPGFDGTNENPQV